MNTLYDGLLGKFEYDDTQYCVQESDADGEYLHYIGSETDGSRITIPHGIRNCHLMFSDTNIKSQPTIPSGVYSMEAMFLNCLDMTQTQSIPYGVENCNSAYSYCPSITHGPRMPDSVTSADFMYDGDTHLRDVPNLSQNLKSCNYMFANCESASDLPDMPDSVTHANGFCINCRSLALPPELSNSLQYINEGFAGCTNLLESPALPDSVIESNNISDGCYWLNTDLDDDFSDISDEAETISAPQLQANTEDFTSKYEAIYNSYHDKQANSPNHQMEALHQSGIASMSRSAENHSMDYGE